MYQPGTGKGSTLLLKRWEKCNQKGLSIKQIFVYFKWSVQYTKISRIRSQNSKLLGCFGVKNVIFSMFLSYQLKNVGEVLLPPVSS